MEDLVDIQVYQPIVNTWKRVHCKQKSASLSNFYIFLLIIVNINMKNDKMICEESLYRIK